MVNNRQDVLDLRARRAEDKFGDIMRAVGASCSSDTGGEPDSQLKKPRRLPDLSRIKMGDNCDFGIEL